MWFTIKDISTKVYTLYFIIVIIIIKINYSSVVTQAQIKTHESVTYPLQAIIQKPKNKIMSMPIQ